MLKSKAYGTFEAAVEGGIQAAKYIGDTRGTDLDFNDMYGHLGSGYVYEVTGRHVISGTINYIIIAGLGKDLGGPEEAAVAEYGDTKGIRYLGSVDAGNYSGISPDGERVEYSLAGETKLVETTEPIA